MVQTAAAVRVVQRSVKRSSVRHSLTCGHWRACGNKNEPNMSKKKRPTGDDLPGSPIPIEALLGSDDVTPNVQPGFDAREIIQAADVILGMDVMTRGTFIVYGRQFLKELSDGERNQELTALVKIELDQDSNELEKLLRLVETVKGRHEFDPGRDSA